MSGERYVAIGGGSQLAKVIREERKFRTDGLMILPLANGTSDGFGMTQWMAFNGAVFTTMADWVYVLAGDYYRPKRRDEF
jgi:hypothetical protein